MTKLFLFINFIFLNGFFLIFLYFDLKFRKVPVNFFKYSYVIAFVLNIFEYLFFFKRIAFFLFLKIIVLILVLFLSLILFFLRIVGGSDGKLFIIIFFMHPILFLNLSFIFTFYLAFSLLFVLYFMINWINNNFLKKIFPFLLIFNVNSKISILKKVYIKSFYRFYNYSELGNYMEGKYLIKSLNLIYNARKNKFQTLCQIRPPLIITIIPSYYLIFYLNLVI